MADSGMLLGRAAAAAASLVLVAAAAQAASGEAIRISGSGCAVETIRPLADAFTKSNPAVKFEIPSNMGSGGGVKAVLAGVLDVAVTSRRLSEAELAQGAREIPYARTPFVFAVHRSMRRSAVTRREVLAIYRGTMTAWRNGTPVRLVLRPRTDSDVDTLLGMWPEIGPALDAAYGREGLVTAMTDQDAADVLESSRGAFGTTTLALVVAGKRNVRVLALDGVRPGLARLADGSYPYAKTLYLVTGRAVPRAARAFIDFVRSPAGASILRTSGCAAVP